MIDYNYLSSVNISLTMHVIKVKYFKKFIHTYDLRKMNQQKDDNIPEEDKVLGSREVTAVVFAESKPIT